MTQAALRKLISLGEGQNLEFKQSLPEDLGRELCAFANSAGGKILIGVSDDGSIKPLANLNKLVSQAQDHARNCEPPVAADVQTIGGVIVIEVKSSREKPHSSKGLFFLRKGANAQRMSRTQIKEFFFKEGLLYFDSAINPRFNFEKDLSPERYAAFAREAGIGADLEMLDVLRNVGLVTDDGMTNAGSLVLGKAGSRYLISATLTCALFQGNNKVKILDQKVFDEDIVSNYRNGLIYLSAHLNTEYIITSTRTNKLELPELALREALINALVHRDYRSPANAQVHIFSDRVEIVNPGGLVGGMELKDLGKRSVPRNPLLFGTLYRMDLVENVGSGIKRIKEALAADKLPEPVLDVDENWFSIAFPRIDRSVSPTVPQKGSLKSSLKSSLKIVRIMAEEPGVTIPELAERIGIGERAVKKNIANLQAAGKLRRVGPDKGGHWEVMD